MSPAAKKKIVLFGCSLDCDERYDSVQEKLWAAAQPPSVDEPYLWLLKLLGKEVAEGVIGAKGVIEVESWLRPIPPSEAINHVMVENFVRFIDKEGSKSYIAEVERWALSIYPDIPCLIGVDHSLTVGMVAAAAKKVGTDNLSMLVLDSHTDTMPMSLISDLISYDIETNPSTVFDPHDPFLRGRPNSCNSSSFLMHLLQSGIIRPKNLIILGVSDEPPKRSFRIKDKRVRDYVCHFEDMKRLGVRLLPKKDLLRSPSKLRRVLSGIDTPYLYLSIDMDIGARNALNGVRFLNRQGLNEKQIYSMLDRITDVVLKNIGLVGMDLMEFNPRKANPEFSGAQDRTYQIAKRVLVSLAASLTERSMGNEI